MKLLSFQRKCSRVKTIDVKKPESNFNRVTSYFRRFVWITVSALVIVLSTMVFLISRQVGDQNERRRLESINEIRGKADYVDNLLGNLSKSVEILSTECEKYYQIKLNEKPIEKNTAFQYLKQTTPYTYSMDATPDSLRPHISSITGLGILSDKLADKKFSKELGFQFHISTFLSSIREQFPDITSIYTISKSNFVNYFPFSPTSEVEYSADFHNYDIFKLGTPGVNAGLKTYVTPIYFDAVGKGLMISIGKPYYDGQEFRGILGVDVSLAFLNDYFAKVVKENQNIVLVNEHDQVLAHANHQKIDNSSIQKLSSLFTADQVTQLAADDILQEDGRIHYVVPLTNVPWRIIVSERESLFATSDSEPIYLSIIAALLALICLLIYLSFRDFIFPSHSLVLFIESQSKGFHSEQKVHREWKSLFEIVGDAFNKNRETIKWLDDQIKIKTAELVKANQILLSQKESLEKMNALKDKVFSIVSHDLRAPIHSLVSVLSILRQGYISNVEFGQFLVQLESNTKQAKFMLENLLQWSLSNLHARKVTPTSIDIKKSIQEHFEILGSLADVKSIKLNRVSDDDLVFRADKGVLDLVLRNLLYNALKFSFENSEVCVSYQRKGNLIEFNIKDHGKGMTDETKSKIFVAGQGVQYGTQNERGTGLGLSLCKEFLENVGGEIWFESIENKGTVFTFTIPDSRINSIL